MTFIVPYALGGATDLCARLVAEGLKNELGQTFVVQNRAGAATQIAANALTASSPDGYTLMLATGTTLAMNPFLYNKLSYHVDDFAPVALVGSTPFVLVSSPAIPAQNLSELITYIKAQPPNSLSFASSGPGTVHHLFMEMFLSRIGAKMTQVSYRGSSPALIDVVSGNVPMMFVDLAAARGFIDQGKLRVFGLASSVRPRFASDIPTIAEAGLPGFAGDAWNGVVVRKGAPRPIIDILNKTINNYISRPETKQMMYGIGVEPMTGTVDEFALFISAERKKWSKVVTDSAIPKAD